MIELTAAEVAAATGGRLAAAPETRVTGSVVIDSRRVEEGSLFVALPGEHVDGHEYAPGAVASGAALVLASRDLDVPCVVVDDVQRALGDLARSVLASLRTEPDGPRVVAVTGSVGKTTTKDLLAQLLSTRGETLWPRGSFNNEIGLPLTVLEADENTRYLVLEMGANAIGDLDYLTSIAPPDVAVVLAVGAAHLGEFGGIEAVARAKAELVTGLAPGGIAILHGDDDRVAAMAAKAPGEVLVFGRRAVPAPDVYAADVRVDADGRASFALVDDRAGRDEHGRHRVGLRLVGEHHVSNALAAATVALELGATVDEVGAALSEATALSPHRMQVTRRADGVTVIDDSYNANPDSMRAALRALTTMAGATRRAVAVLGEMLELGPDSPAAHEDIGALAARTGVDLLVTVGDGARGIRDGARREGLEDDATRFVPDVADASALLANDLRDGDVVLVKASNGSGLWRLGDELAGEVRP